VDEQAASLQSAIIEIAHARRRFSYQRIHDLLRQDFPNVNDKRIYRRYREANLGGASAKRSGSRQASARP